MKDNQVRQQARPKRNNYYANDNKKSYNKNNYQARGRRPMPRRKPSSVKIIPLGGLGQIGMNITAFECNNQILIVDCGLAFPDEDMLGIDLVIPDITYLRIMQARFVDWLSLMVMRTILERFLISRRN